MLHNQELSTPSSASFPTIQQGADLFFQAAIRYGYRYVFGNPGTTEAPFVDALARYPQLRFLLFLQENVNACVLLRRNNFDPPLP